MPNNHSTLTSLFKDIADAIRRKTGGTASIAADAFPSAIRAIETTGGGSPGAAGDYRALTGMIEGTLSGAYTNYDCRSVTPYALRFCQQAEHLAFPNASTIVDGAFYDLNGLVNINLARVREIGNEAFRNCTNLENVNIQNCLSIRESVFQNLRKLSSINIDSLEFIGSSTFRDCGIPRIEGPKVRGIWNYGFFNANKLSYVSFPKLEYIGNDAFGNCTSLKELILPNLLITRNYNFYNCTALSYVEFNVYTGITPNPLPYSGYGNVECLYLFSGCTALKSVSMPECKQFLSEFFRYCTALEYVNAPKIEFISDCFNYCHSLKEAIFPSLTRVGYDTFWQCYALSKVSMPLVSRVDTHGFNECTSLSVLSLPNCNYFSYRAFSGCTALGQLILLSSSVCSLYDIDVFINTPIRVLDYLGYYGSIYVPGDLVDAYKSANNWSLISDRITAYLGS